jgi:hypothetical protein
MNDGLEQVNSQIEYFMTQLERRTGLRPDQINDAIREIIWLHERRKRYERWGDWFARSVISVFVTAFFAGAAWSLVHFVKFIAGAE